MVSNLDNNNGRTASEEALRNPLILHQIFPNLPTNFLLKSASVVNKTWNRAARTCLRDHKKCTAYKPTESECEYIRELYARCCDMTSEGRVVPFNSLKMYSSRCGDESPDLDGPDDVVKIMKNLRSMLKLKHLEIKWLWTWPVPDCSVHNTLQTLLHTYANDLVTLKIMDLSTRHGSCLSGWPSSFPKLEDIIIQNTPAYEKDWPACKLVLSDLLDRAPNLKRIVAEDVDTLKIIPEGKYMLLSKMEFNVVTVENEHLLRKIAQDKPNLQDLRIGPPICSAGFAWDFLFNGDNRIDGLNPRERYVRALEILLQACHETLEVISAEAFFTFDELSFPPLMNLKKLRLKNLRPGRIGGGKTVGMWNAMVFSIDYNRNMPGLEEIEIVINTVSEPFGVMCSSSSLVWPEFDPHAGSFAINSSQSVCKLTLELEVRLVRWSVIPSVFPNVRVLQLRVNDTILLGQHPLPFAEIFQVWPHLEQLEVTGERNYLDRNYDADFCGIYEEEAELLRQKADYDDGGEFLKNLHIVPIRPSLLAMPNLRRVFIQLGLKDLTRPGDERLNFISKVTTHVALKEIPQAFISGVLS